MTDKSKWLMIKKMGQYLRCVIDFPFMGLFYRVFIMCIVRYAKLMRLLYLVLSCVGFGTELWSVVTSNKSRFFFSFWLFYKHITIVMNPVFLPTPYRWMRQFLIPPLLFFTSRSWMLLHVLNANNHSALNVYL